jgi:hypothetical protein
MLLALYHPHPVAKTAGTIVFVGEFFLLMYCFGIHKRKWLLRCGFTALSAWALYDLWWCR